MSETKKVSYIATFNDGYSFRSLIDFLKLSLNDANLFFSKDKITLREITPLGAVLFDVVINTNEIGEYKFFSNTEEHFGFDFIELKNSFNSIGKKSSIKIWKYENNRNIWIQRVNKSPQTSSNHDYITHKDVNVPVHVDLPDYDSGPNCTINSSEFADMCKSIISKKCKCTHVIIKGFPCGVVFESHEETKVSGRIHTFGDCNIKPGEEKLIDPNQERVTDTDLQYNSENKICEIKVGINLIKALAKINSFAPKRNNTMQIYLSKDAPICMITKIGDYGTMKILIKEIDDMNSD